MTESVLPSAAAAVPVIPARADSPARIAWRRFRHNRVAVVALAVLITFALLAIFAPWIAPQDPYQAVPADSLQSPSVGHWMGTDLLGRDVFSRVVHGARISMLIGLFSVAIAGGIGTLIGVFSGYYGGGVDSALMRFMDIMMAFPGILLALAIVSVLGPGIGNVMIAVGIGGIPDYARLVRGSVLSIKQEVYVDAARCLGASDLRLVLRHILPNALPPALVLASMSYGWALLSAAGLSFVGLGAKPPAAEWGAMLADGRGLLWEAPWTVAFPGLAIMCVVLSTNLLGDALRDVLDPRMRS